jgi:DNA-3-methyladenine glycosylase
MRARRGLSRPGRLARTPRSPDRAAHLEDLCSGPGKLTQALGISLGENDSSLSVGPVRIGPRPPGWEDPPVLEGTRIGISRAVELRWRFCVADCRHVSRPRPSAPGGTDAARRRGSR